MCTYFLVINAVIQLDHIHWGAEIGQQTQSASLKAAFQDVTSINTLHKAVRIKLLYDLISMNAFAKLHFQK